MFLFFQQTSHTRWHKWNFDSETLTAKIDVVSVMHVFSPRAIMVSEVFVCESETDCSDLGCLHPFNKVIDLGAKTKNKKKLYIEAVKTLSL